jgi:glutaredoxin
MGSVENRSPRTPLAERHLTRRWVPCLILLALVWPAAGCRKAERTSGSKADAPLGPTETPPPMQGPGVLYVWSTSEGIFKTTETPSEIPAEARNLVRVLVPGHSSGSEANVWIVDLNASPPTPRPFPRAEWEARGKIARDALVAAAKPDPASAPRQVAGTGIHATIYGASWCKPCHLAEDYLRSRGAKVQKRDIEEDASASEEMRAKLRAAGLSGASIPVIDVAGTILVGFSQGSIDRALSLAQKKP